MTTVISVENLSKSYRLGQIGTGTLTNDLKVWWAKKRGLPNPLLKFGTKDHGNRDGETIWALKDVNFTVEQGEVLGIIGRNGAGKSTLLKILSRVTAPTTGRVKVKGRIASLLEVGTGFHPDLTGRENIYLNGAILGMTKEEVKSKFDEIVNFAGLEKFVDTPVKRYSSGMYVRLAFAVSAHLESEILLVDEVLAVGDAEFQKKCLGKMGDVSREGRTVFFVSHNINSIEQLTSKCLHLNNGTVLNLGLTNQIISEYLRIISLDTPRKFKTIRNDFEIINFSSQDQFNIFNYNTPISLRFDLVTHELVDSLYLSIGIFSISGTRILTSWNTISNIHTQNISCNLIIQNHNLAPGNYKVNLVIKLPTSDYVIFSDTIVFTISIEGINDPNLINHGSNVGTFIPLDILVLDGQSIPNL